MSEHAASLLSGWDSFYVITGSAAAALTGLMFVVIALTGQALEATANTIVLVRAWGTPTVVHFGAVLMLAAIFTTPGHSVPTLSACVSACGVAGLVLSRWVVTQARRQTEYVPQPEHWRWHLTLPVLAYTALLAAAAALWWRAAPALVLVGAATLLLLFIGIHNAWDAAIWVSIGRRATAPHRPPGRGPGS